MCKEHIIFIYACDGRTLFSSDCINLFILRRVENPCGGGRIPAAETPYVFLRRQMGAATVAEEKNTATITSYVLCGATFRGETKGLGTTSSV